MPLNFFDYEIPVLKALVHLGGSAQVKNVYPEVEKIMKPQFQLNPEEYGARRQGEIVWMNRVRWAREYLKTKGQLDGSRRGWWTITEAGKDRLRIFEETGKDADEGKPTLDGIDASIEETETSPETTFKQLEEFHTHGDILGVRGIVYEPTNEQGVVLLFAVLCRDLGFNIEAIRTKFPDALLDRKNEKGTFNKCHAEFEFKASNFKVHKHVVDQCSLIICWVNDWHDCPIEILELRKEVRRFKGEDTSSGGNA